MYRGNTVEVLMFLSGKARAFAEYLGSTHWKNDFDAVWSDERHILDSNGADEN